MGPWSSAVDFYIIQIAIRNGYTAAINATNYMQKISL